MFRRRKKVFLGQRIREAVWPRSGWRRSTQYVFKRLARLPGTPYALAGGFACGAAVSFTPFVGFHFVISAFLAWIIRANVLAAVIGTVVGNPWTFPFIWVWIYKVGVWMGVGGTAATMHSLDFSGLFGAMLDASLRFDMVYLLETSWPLWGPMLVGSIPTGIIVWLAFYWPVKSTIEAYHNRRRARLERRNATETREDVARNR